MNITLHLRVAPYVGAWIETSLFCSPNALDQVAPYVGAWIETKKELSKMEIELSRTLCGCVD